MNKRLFVAGLPFTTTSEELRDLFSGIGAVVAANVIQDRDTGRSKGFGFVEMANDEDAETAINMFHGKDFDGRSLTVNEARPMEDRPRTGGGSNFRSGGASRGGSRDFNSNPRSSGTGRW